ncbi:MAG: cell wall-binding repeat-containing protein [Desulfitobacterium sp.]
MQKLKKNLVGFFLTATFILSTATPSFAYIIGNEHRIAGEDRYATAATIAQKGWTQSDVAILVSGENYPDALVATSLAKLHDAPILLSRKDNLPEDTKLTLSHLGVKRAILVGGTGVLAEQLQTNLHTMGIDSSRLAGQDRYETAIAVAKEVGNASEVVIATGEDFADALSISAIAAYKNMPIILVPSKRMPSATQSYLVANDITKTYVVGSSEIISDAVALQFPNTERITGVSKYDRNINIINRFQADLQGDQVFLATGNNYADAIAGSAYAAKLNAPIVLVTDVLPKTTRDYLIGKLTEKDLTILGGEGVVRGTILNETAGSRGSRGGNTRSLDPLSDLGTNEAKVALVFGTSAGTVYKTAAEAEANMVNVSMDVWKLNSKGEKYAAKATVKVNKAIAERVKSVFEEIFAGEEKYPIHVVQGYSWRGGTSEHNYGLAIDINPNENYMVDSSGSVVAGSFWDPNKSPYSITENGDVVTAFKKYGFAWGGNAWKSSKDYMHFSYLGK